MSCNPHCKPSFGKVDHFDPAQMPWTKATHAFWGGLQGWFPEGMEVLYVGSTPEPEPEPPSKGTLAASALFWMAQILKLWWSSAGKDLSHQKSEARNQLLKPVDTGWVESWKCKPLKLLNSSKHSSSIPVSSFFSTKESLHR